MPIINQVVKGGGTTPTGTIQITTNGTHDVTNYASADVQVPTTAPQIYRVFREDNGKLTNSITTPFIPLPSTITDIDSYMLYAAYKGTPSSVLSGAIDLSSLTQMTGTASCAYAFTSCTGITSVDLSSVTQITGGNSLYNAFTSCTGITSVDLSSLTIVSGSSACNNTFSGCTGLINVDLSSLNTISGSDACRNMFSYCSSLTTIDLSSLTTISSKCTEMFASCTSLTTVYLSSLSTINATQGCISMFIGCTALTSIDFPSLTALKASYAFSSAFEQCSGLTRISFYALTPSSFGSYTNQFNSMLSGVTGCTVHFPMAIQSTIGSWTSVTGGFGGTNTTVLFDIVTSLTGADSNTYTRKQKESTSTATAWTYNDTLYYTSGITEPSVGDTIYSDSACTTAVTTISAIA